MRTFKTKSFVVVSPSPKKHSRDNSISPSKQTKSVISVKVKGKDIPISQIRAGGVDIMLSKRFLRKGPIPQHFDPRIYVTNQLKIQDIVDLKEVFDTYDSTGMGVLLPNDIKLLMQQHGFNPSKIMAQFDQQQAGGISFSQFVRAMQCKPHINQTKREIKTVFKKYDRDGKGHIDFNDMKQMNRHVKENLDQQTLAILFKRAYSNQYGKISFEDFYNVMTRQIYL